MSYGIAKRVSKNGDNFGKGEIEGVVAPETAAHAAGTAALLPMLSLGVPGSPTAAVLLGGLLIWGLQPGPLLFVEQKEFVWGLIASMYLGNVVGLIVVLTCVPLFAAILRIPFSIIAPIILVICAIGAYTVHNSTFDVVMMLVFGVIGYVLKKCNYPLAPMVLAIVLGDKAEEAFRQSLLASQGSLGIFLSNGLVELDHGARPDRAVLAADLERDDAAAAAAGDLRPSRGLGLTGLWAERAGRPRNSPVDQQGASWVAPCGRLWNIVYQRVKSDFSMSATDRSSGASVRLEDAQAGEPAVLPRGRGRADRQPRELQAQGLYGAQERHRLDGRLSQPRRHPARRAPAGAGFRHQPHAGARGDGAARARRASCARCRAAASTSCARPSSEVIEMITAWAALESMAARLITEKASDDEIAALRKMFATFEDGELHAQLDEYSEVNIEFHQTIIRMSGNGVLIELAENLFTHMRMIRRKTIGEKDRANRSIRDHMNIIEALEARDTARAEDLVRNHALGLAEHVAKYADYLD